MDKSATSVTTLLLGPTILGHIWKHTVEKSQTNVTNVTTPLLRKAISGHIWKRTVEKSHTNVTTSTLSFFSERSFEDKFKNTQRRKVKQMQPMWLFILSGRQFEETFKNAQWRKVKKNAANVIFHPLWLPILGDIWKCTVEKSQIDATDVTLSLLGPTILEAQFKIFGKKSGFCLNQERGVGGERIPSFGKIFQKWNLH